MGKTTIACKHINFITNLDLFTHSMVDFMISSRSIQPIDSSSVQENEMS